MSAAWQPLLDWWFGAAGCGPAPTAVEVAAARTKLWFGKHDRQDVDARQRFGTLVEQALAGELGDWQAHAQGWLATLLLLDQLPRMIYRDTPRAFAGDRLAQALVQEGLARSLERQLAPIQQVFVYLVLEHAEDLATQNLAVQHFTALRDAASSAERALFADYLDYAERHQRVIARFARFPHRNSILGRSSRAEELAFLEEPGSRF
ncbi:DUF924 family protein [Pseudomonas sp. UBA2684]|uniref:DUF924 family protein n=1 Tax=Pseudomonas sp. UBA2684 TaxID=1947311 RepID=UPI000E8ED315|nr:DUF924 family protein [Pseudomonas sp. UBA2684]HBX54381.1 DUF924 domain-containing protein [Pseudomonas sp.]|tara:strand:+ start:10900 stop:11517 length:618 start_codon:yes stop_codon:yes gene_type:complete